MRMYGLLPFRKTVERLRKQDEQDTICIRDLFIIYNGILSITKHCIIPPSLSFNNSIFNSRHVATNNGFAIIFPTCSLAASV